MNLINIIDEIINNKMKLYSINNMKTINEKSLKKHTQILKKQIDKYNNLYIDILSNSDYEVLRDAILHINKNIKLKEDDINTVINRQIWLDEKIDNASSDSEINTYELIKDNDKEYLDKVYYNKKLFEIYKEDLKKYKKENNKNYNK